jgi:hypothetical protein
MNKTTQPQLYFLAASLFLACGDDGGEIIEGNGLSGVPEFAVFANATITEEMLDENPWAVFGSAWGTVHVATFTRPLNEACQLLSLDNDINLARLTEVVKGRSLVRVPTFRLGFFDAPAQQGFVPTERFTFTAIAHDNPVTQVIVGQTTVDYASAECQSEDQFDCLRTVTCADGRPCISGVFPEPEVTLDTSFSCD